ncbi:MAG: TolC family protein [Proteobacteria bacterium]|nr:TolC family protein [Pseudomonadota bacterium]
MINASTAGSLAAPMFMLFDSRWRRIYTTPMIALVIGCLFSGLVFAGNSTIRETPVFKESKTYDLGRLLELGMANNPKTRAAWFRAEAAYAGSREARASYFPKVGAAFEGGVDKWYTPAISAPNVFTRQQATTVLSIEYLLLDFGRRAADVSRAVALFDASGFVYERKLQEVVFEIQSRYFTHEAALWKERAAASLLEFARTADQTIEMEVRNGLSARPELLRARKNVLDAQYELEAARTLVRNTLGELCIAVGIPANSRLTLASNDLPTSSGDLRESAGKLIESALTSRPDLAARAADVGNYAYSAFQYAAETGKDKGTNAAGINGYGGFITAKWDLFDGFERVERVRKRRDEERAAKEELEDSRLAATRDVWTSYHDTLSAARRVDFAEGFVASAQENLNATEAAYKAGLSQISELTEAAGQLAAARSVRAGAVADYSTNLAALALAVGTMPN